MAFSPSIAQLTIIVILLHTFQTTQCAKTEPSVEQDERIGVENESKPTIRRPLRIAQVCSPWLPIPPKKYGGTERVAYFLIEELVRRGHNVTLFSTTDSNTTSANLFTHPKFTSAMHPPPRTVSWEVYFLWIFEQLRRHADDFDIIHFHTSEQYNIVHGFSGRTVTTIHSKIDWSQLMILFDTFTDVPIVSISDDQRTHAAVHPLYAGTVYHGIMRDQFTFNPDLGPTKRPYLAWLGRFAADKAPDMAIRIAVEAGIPLKLAGNIAEKVYWLERVKPLMDQHPDLVEFVGEINDTQKDHFLGNALAMLFTSEWAEPFGLVMIEALACGTPVVGRSRGSVPEIVEDGVTGILFKTLDEGVEAVKAVGQLDRTKVRQTFERRFSVEAMVDGYEQIYANLILEEQEAQRQRCRS